MAAINSGSILLSRVVVAKETDFGVTAFASAGTAAGTAWPTTNTNGRRLVIDPTGYLTPGLTVDDQSDKSVGLLVRAIAQRTTVTAKMPTISLNSPAIPVNELPIWLSGIQNPTSNPVALTAAQATAMGLANGTSNAWNFNYVLAGGTSGTAIPAAKSLTVFATGGNLNPAAEQYTLNYVLPTKISIKASTDGLTSASVDAFGQTLTNVGATAGTASQVFVNDALPQDVYNMAGRLWNLYYYANGTTWGTDANAAATAVISGGSAFSYLSDWSLDLTTPNQPIVYQAGSINLTGHSQYANPLVGDVSFTVSGGSDAMNQIFTPYNTGSPTYWRLSWTDGTRRVDIMFTLILTEVMPLAGDTNGVTTITANGVVNYDTVSATALKIRVISDTLSALP
jgi:hypothetical protein